jgi:hypothetical protein
MLEGMSCATESAFACCVELLGDEPGAHAPELLRQALRTLSALSPDADAPQELSIAAPAALLAAARDDTESAELVRLLLRTRARPADSLRDPAGLPARLGVEGRLALLGWWLGSGEPAVASAHMLALLGEGPSKEREERGERIAALLLPWTLTAQEARLGELFVACERALDAGSPERFAVRRTALLCELPGVRVDPALLKRALREDSPARGPDLALLGALGGLGVVTARVKLVELLVASVDGPEPAATPPRELLAAIERMLDGLYAHGRDLEAGDLVSSFLRLLRSPPEASWAAGLEPGEWPPPPRLRLRPLEEAERRLPEGSL